MTPTLSLDDIQLPADDANKPADINMDPNAGDEGVVKDPEKKDEKIETPAKTEDKPADDKGEKKEEKPEDKKPGDKEVDKPEETEEEKKIREDKEKEDKEKEEKLKPFHEHPEWQKMIKDREEDKKVIEKLTTQIDTLIKVKGVDPEGKETMVTTAKERIKKDLQEGWKPTDQLELVERYGEYLKEELKQEKDAQTKESEVTEEKRKEAVEQAEKQINEFWTEKKVEDTTVKDKVLKLVLDWKADGTIPSPTIGTLKLAYNVLESRGELKTTPVEKKDETKPEKVEDADKKAQEALDKKKETLKKTNKPVSSGDKPDATGKKSYASLNKRSLDDIVNDAASHLG